MTVPVMPGILDQAPPFPSNFMCANCFSITGGDSKAVWKIHPEITGGNSAFWLGRTGYEWAVITQAFMLADDRSNGNGNDLDIRSHKIYAVKAFRKAVSADYMMWDYGLSGCNVSLLDAKRFVEFVQDVLANETYTGKVMTDFRRAVNEKRLDLDNIEAGIQGFNSRNPYTGANRYADTTLSLTLQAFADRAGTFYVVLLTRDTGSNGAVNERVLRSAFNSYDSADRYFNSTALTQRVNASKCSIDILPGSDSNPPF